MNKTLFNTSQSKTNTTNKAGGTAYALSNEQLLAQLSATGMLADTYYTGADEQLQTVLTTAKKVDEKFLAQATIYAAEKGFLKDMTALLVAYMAVAKNPYWKTVFHRVITTGKLLRNFVQIIRSGALGRKSFGRSIKREINNWILNRKFYKLFNDAVGGTSDGSVSMADIIKMAHPRVPRDPDSTIRAMLGYIVGKEYNIRALPEPAKGFELYKRGETKEIPDVEFRRLTNFDLTVDNWRTVAQRMGWHALRINLSSLKERGVFDDKEFTKKMADRLRNKEEILRSKIFPLQLLAAYTYGRDLPYAITEALQDALDFAMDNIPSIDGNVVVCVDTSGSMTGCRWSGNRGSASSEITAMDVAALMAAGIIRKNPEAKVVPFDTCVHPMKINPRDSVMTITKQLTRNGGGTDLGCAGEYITKQGWPVDVLFMLSDNMSWYNSSLYANHRYGYSTGIQHHVNEMRKRNPKLKVVNVDISSDDSIQLLASEGTMNIGGFNQTIFDTIIDFINGKYGMDAWVESIRTIEL